MTLALRAKAELRKRMRSVRNALPERAVVERSSRITERLLPKLSGASSVALFWPIENKKEVDLRQLDEQLRVKGVRLAYPRLEETSPMSFRAVADPQELSEQGHGFLEPCADAAVVSQLDFVVAPALALDPSGRRLGYGRGYYDEALRPMTGTRFVGVAFDFQLLVDLPETDGDVRMHEIVTDVREFVIA